jgi:fused signal recognition particle receptor
MGFFDRIKKGLAKTRQVLNTDIRDLFKSKGELVDETFLERLQEILIRTDMGVAAADQIVQRVAKDFRARVVSMGEVLATVKAELQSLMPAQADPISLSADGPTVIMVVGVNGSGKTTSIAKLANFFKSQGKKVVLGAGDTFRAAAVEQLAIWAQRSGSEIVRGDQGTDPASVAHRAVAHAIESKADVCIVDTAGRLQTQSHLMKELGKVHRVIGKLLPGAPHEVILVLDATAGQNGISQARGFTDAVQCTGIFLAKIDGSAKGGVVIPIKQQFQLPVKFVGTGEGLDDMGYFDPGDFTNALFADAEQVTYEPSA